MAELFASGRLVDLILLLVALETAGLFLVWRYARRGIAPGALLPNVLAGAWLLLTLRLVQTGADWTWCSASLAAAGAAHVADLYQRWRS